MNPKTSEIPFNAFFGTGQEEQLSPFLSPSGRKWAIHLPLKASMLAAVLLAGAYLATWFALPDNFAYLLLVFVYFLAGIPALIESVEDLASYQINIDVLMTLAAFGSVLIGSPLEGALLLVLFSISGAMEDAVTKKAKDSISSLHKLAPSFANVLDEDGVSIEKALDDVRAGTKILVKAGQVIPLDGIVVDGTSSVNLVHLTGENMPVTKKPGDDVPAGAQNLEGVLVINVTHTNQDSTLAKIIQLVTNAQEAKPKLQRWFDNLSERYAKTIIFLAALVAVSFPHILSIPYLGPEGSIYRALAFLIAASPCALIIAIPIAYLSAIGACAKKGIVLKGGLVLDSLGACEAIAFDKTGTLTTGHLCCLGIESLENKDVSNVLDIAFALEQNAVHPIAQAITTYALAQGAKPAALTDFKSIPGFGLEAIASGVDVFIGNLEYIEPKLAEASRNKLNSRYEELSREGEILAFLMVGQDLYIFRFSDTIRKEVPDVLRRLREDGYRLLMLTGDHQASADRIAVELKIDEVHAHLKPEDKLRAVEKLAKKMHLAMVGDGVNDAPALARATVGISMGKVGSSAAIEAADVVLLQDNIERLDWLMKKAKATKWIVAENLMIATAAIFIASIPALLGLVPLWLAVVLHEGGTVIVGLNGLRLLKS
jgi:Cd2+/Zn2+-exporting ATPase